MCTENSDLRIMEQFESDCRSIFKDYTMDISIFRKEDFTGYTVPNIQENFEMWKDFAI